MEERSFLKPALSLAMLAAGLVMSAVGVDWFAPVGVRAAWYAVAFLPVGLGVIREAWECAAKGDVFSEFMLMSVASVGAFAIGEFPEAVAVMLFYCVSWSSVPTRLSSLTAARSWRKSPRTCAWAR